MLPAATLESFIRRVDACRKGQYVPFLFVVSLSCIRWTERLPGLRCAWLVSPFHAMALRNC